MMSGAKKRVPKRRFKEFLNAGDWEQRKLIDIAKTFIGLVTTMTENYRDSGTLLIRNSDIKEGQFLFSENPIHLDEEFAEKNKTRRLQIGDVVTVHTGDIGTSAVIEEKEAGAIGFATINTRTDKSILNPYFLATYFNTEKHKCYANSVSTGDGRSNYNIKDFNKLVISVPTLDEQERISVLINDINIIITLHQRKLDKLQATKKALLQEMFPEEGQDKPKRRFKGFTDAWEQRKLGDIATFSKGNGYSKSDLGSSGDPIILYGRLYTNYETTISNVDTFVELKDKSIISQGGEVIVPASGETAEDISRASVVKNQGIIIGGDLNVIKANYLLDPTFLALTISNGEQQKELSKRAQGKSVVHLHNSDLQEVNLTFPLLNEQKEISTLFEKMDNIITLHQRKLDKLKNLKQAYLNEMFV